VPVYKGSFRIVQPNVVLEDIRRQVEAGATHITFGDPDFFNGPRHATALVTDLHRQFPEVTYDVTIKVEHLLRFAHLVPTLRDSGCVLVTSALESVDDRILSVLDKNHTWADCRRVVSMLREAGLALNSTFVAFTPWTTLEGYVDLLTELVEADLVDTISPVQYGIRLLIPAGSRLLELSDVRELVEGFDHAALYYPWRHSDPAVDRLHATVLAIVKESQKHNQPRRQVFAKIWEIARAAHSALAAAGVRALDLDLAPSRATIPYLTEPWFC
jgi:hypothetical protein